MFPMLHIYEADEGFGIFKRRTNVGRVTVMIPDGFRFEYAFQNGVPVEGDLSIAFEIQESGVKEIEVGLVPQ